MVEGTNGVFHSSELTGQMKISLVIKNVQPD